MKDINIEKAISRVEEKFHGQIIFIAHAHKDQIRWGCKKCGYCFSRSPRNILASKGNPCKACNILSSPYRLCERDFLEKVQKLMPKYGEKIYFHVQYAYPGLIGKSRELTVDLALMDRRGIIENELPKAICEVNENSHRSYSSNQDNLREYYEKKENFFVSKDISFNEFDYKYDSETQIPIPLFTMSDLEKILDKVISLNESMGRKIL